MLRTLATTLLAALPAAAQCALCRTAAAAQGERAAAALNTAILVLFFPAMVVFCGVYFFAFKHRHGGDGREEDRW